MKTVFILIALLPNILFAAETEIDLKEFALLYFDKMKATQAPNATTQHLENYLALLKADVGHSHLPWVVDDSRMPDGKAAMRKGMMFYLGAHSEYNAELLNVFTFNQSAVAIRYKTMPKAFTHKTINRLNTLKP